MKKLVFAFRGNNSFMQEIAALADRTGIPVRVVQTVTSSPHQGWLEYSRDEVVITDETLYKEVYAETGTHPIRAYTSLAMKLSQSSLLEGRMAFCEKMVRIAGLVPVILESHFGDHEPRNDRSIELRIPTISEDIFSYEEDRDILKGNIHEALGTLGLKINEVCLLADHHLLYIKYSDVSLQKSGLIGTTIIPICPCCNWRYLTRPNHWGDDGPFKSLAVVEPLAEATLRLQDVLQSIIDWSNNM